MTLNFSASEFNPVEVYSFETETKLYEIPYNSPQGQTFRGLQTVAEKIIYLRDNGKQITKTQGQDGRIMIPQPGGWYHRNVAQLEYMLHSGTVLGEKYGKIEDREEKETFWEKNVTRVREWPEWIVRDQTFH